ncbi:MAG: anaerobic ribonucleoside-triphosphate reductase activating protein [Prevotellaceae bacterium]|jgi:anaerobic ribonucleoside-triphosphate reductase activating protein|nr:anaerobic ribonucleoside-triphosphate reductase activating protein [Prevotellaceae bacterium]
MLKYISYDIVFQEIPEEITLAVNISGCTIRCKDCHSPHLQEDIGEPLTREALSHLINRYGNAITCICFMGGDSAPHEILRLAQFVRKQTSANIKTAWYSGRSSLLDEFSIDCFDYIKTGKYIARLGGLNSLTTNQRLYRIANREMIDITAYFHNNNFKQKQ